VKPVVTSRSPFRVRKRIRFSHVDAAGIVFYPRYFELYNEVVEDWFAAALELPFDQLVDRLSAGVPTVTIACEFTAPTRLGEDLDFELRVAELGRSSFALLVDAHAGTELRLRGRSTLVFARLSEHGPLRPQPIPAELRGRMESFLA